MTEIRRADPAARRQVVWLLIAGALVGALLLFAFERHLASLREWIYADPHAASGRLRRTFVGLGVVLSAPVLAFAAYLWTYGAKVLRTQESPPPGYRVIRDTLVLRGQAARIRGHAFRILAAVLGTASLLFWLLLWRLARLLAAGLP